MELINRTDANLNMALIANAKAKSDAQKALMGRCIYMLEKMPAVKAVTIEQLEQMYEKF